MSFRDGVDKSILLTGSGSSWSGQAARRPLSGAVRPHRRTVSLLLRCVPGAAEACSAPRTTEAAEDERDAVLGRSAAQGLQARAWLTGGRKNSTEGLAGRGDAVCAVSGTRHAARRTAWPRPGSDGLLKAACCSGTWTPPPRHHRTWPPGGRALAGTDHGRELRAAAASGYGLRK